jgi:hypothetical protein
VIPVSISDIIISDTQRENMNENVKADLDKLDTLRDLALCGSEEHYQEAQQAYEELRSELLEHEKCEGCDGDAITKELRSKNIDAETVKPPDVKKDGESGWESNKDDENPNDLPWPEENEAKD